MKVCLGFKGNKKCRKQTKKKDGHNGRVVTQSDQAPTWWDRSVSKVSEKIQICCPCERVLATTFKHFKVLTPPSHPRTQTEICSSKVTGPHEEEGKYLMFVPSSLDGRWQVRAV